MLKKLLSPIGLIAAGIIAALILPFIASAGTTLFPSGGGTGSTSPSGILFGNGTSPIQTLTVGSGLTLTGSTLTSTGGGSGASPDWQKTADLLGLTPTSTIGILVNASSTIGNGTATTGLTVIGGATTTSLVITGLAPGNAPRALGITSTNQLTTTFSSNSLLQSLTDETGTGLAVFATTPTFNTSLVVPTVRGGAAVGSSLILRSTSAVGTTDFIEFDTGSSIEKARILSNGNLGIGTTSPFALLSINTLSGATGSLGTLFAIASSTASGTSTLFSISNTGSVNQTGSYSHFGTAQSNVAPCTSTALPNQSCQELIGNDNTDGGMGYFVQNINSGGNAYSGYNLLNDLWRSDQTEYAGLYLNSKGHNSTTFGGSQATYNEAALINTVGRLSLIAGTSTSEGLINFYTGGIATSSERGRITSTGLWGIGTTSPFAKLSVHLNPTDSVISTTAFAIASSTGSATTTLFSVSNSGSTTAANGFNITTGCYAVSGACLATGGSVTNIATTWPIIGGPITTTGTLTFGGLSTSTNLTVGRIPYVTGANTLADIATSSLGVTGPITFSGTLGSQIGGANGSFGCATCSTFQFPWTPTTYSGVNVNSTSTPFWLTATSPFSLIASSTFVTNASSTNSTISGALYIPTSSSQSPTVAGQLAHDTTDNQLKLGTGAATTVFDQRRFFTFGYATSSPWTGTTTPLNIGPIPVAGTFTGATCTTDTGTLGVDFFYGPTPTHPAYIPTASTTANFFTWSSSNTPGANASSTVKFGTPVGSPTSISCTATFTISGT